MGIIFKNESMCPTKNNQLRNYRSELSLQRDVWETASRYHPRGFSGQQFTIEDAEVSLGPRRQMPKKYWTGQITEDKFYGTK